MSQTFFETLRFLTPVTAVVVVFMITVLSIGLTVIKFVDQIAEFINSAISEPFVQSDKKGECV